MSQCSGSFYERSNTFTNKACQCAEKSANAAIQSKQIYDTFKSIYIGTFPSDPTPPFGTNFQVGALYFNSTVDAMYVYDGTNWIFASPTTLAIGPSADDVLSISTNTIAAVSPGGDKVVFYDQSAGKLTYLDIGSFLSLTGTTLNSIPPSVNTSAADILTVTGNEIFADAASSDKLVFYDLSANKLTYLDIGPYLSITGTTINSAAPTVNATAADILTVTNNEIFADDAGADRLVFWDDSDSKLSYMQVGSGLLITGTTLSSTGIGGSTSTDNAIVRADSTANTVQESNFIIADNATASPNNTVNHASIQATGATTNVSVSIAPKGTGAFMLQVPNAASSGGNARGESAVDLQTVRSAATQVAAGTRSFIGGGSNNSTGSADSVCCGGTSNTASGFQSVVIGGRSNTASSDRAIAGGDGCNANSGSNALAIGASNNASGSASCALNQSTIASQGATMAIGNSSRADRLSFFAHASGAFNDIGDAQSFRAVLRCRTTTNAAVEMALDGATTYLTIPSGKGIFCNIKVMGISSTGATVATFERQYAAKNVAGTSSQIFAAVTIGIDNAAGTSLEVATVDAGDYIRIRPTGLAATIIRWVASVDAVECALGT
jgi:hypothetical protein